MKRVRTPSRARSGSSRSIVSTKISINASTSSVGRDQFSVENAYTQSDSTPRSIAASTERRSARVPARCPAATGRRRRLAQRPLPSMMIATERATSGSSRSPGALKPLSVRSLVRRFTSLGPRFGASDLQDLRFLALENLVDLGDVVIGELLGTLFSPTLLVVPHVAVADELLEMVDAVAPDVPHGDPPFLGQVADHLDQLLAPLLRQRRDRQPDDLAVIRGRQAQVRLLQRALDRLDRARVVRLDREQPRLGHVDGGELVQGGLLTVVVHPNPVEKRCRGAPGPDRGELVRSRLDRLVHATLCVVEQVIDHASLRGVEMIVPILSPATTRSIMPGSSRPNT